MRITKFIAGTIVAFFFVFNIKIPYLYSTSVLAVIIGIMICLGRISLSINGIKKYVASSAALLTLFLVVVIVIYTSIITVFQDEYDFQFPSLMVSALFFMTMAPIVAMSIYILAKESLARSLVLLNAIFYIQSFVIIGAFFFVDFREVIRSFQDVSQLDAVSKYYGGAIRGLSLSGGLFFSLTVLFVFHFCLASYRNIVGQIWRGEKLLIYISMLASLSVGRAAFLGILVYMATSFMKKNINTHRYGFTFEPLLHAGVPVVLLFIVLYVQPFNYGGYEKELLDYTKFAFEFAYNYIENDDFSTSSTNTLMTMYFLPDLKTVLIGDGRYVSIDGGYYMGSDSGYMRPVLLAGLPLLAILWVANLAMISRFKYWPEGGEVFYLIVFVLVVLNFKGELYVYNYSFACFIPMLYSLFVFSFDGPRVFCRHRA